jgi:hypothetical protein
MGAGITILLRSEDVINTIYAGILVIVLYFDVGSLIASALPTPYEDG